MDELLSSCGEKYLKYASNFAENGVDTVKDLEAVDLNDFELLGIPKFHLKNILNKATAAPPAGGDKNAKPDDAPETATFGAVKDNVPYSRSNGQSSTAKPRGDNSVRSRLLKFYDLYNPDKINNDEAIDALLKQYQGNTAQLFADLERKYVLGARTKAVASGGVRKPPVRTGATKTDMITDGLWKLYSADIRAVEETYEFPKFHSPLLNRVDFEAKPIVLLIGQYSVGKTSFIKFLLERDFPGIRIGPEPTTDTFTCVMHGNEERMIPGNAAAVDSSKPFKSLRDFGMGFLNKFNVAELPAPVLESIIFVDTPGILSGEKQRIGRNYNFPKIVEWFAYKADRILLLFDAHKLDISDEFRLALDCIKGHDDKVRVVLNKADMVSNQQLLRVYGALMWSLGKVFKTPEVLRVYVGSYWDQPYADQHNAELFDAEANDLLSDLRALPRHSATRKINEFVKRTRRLRVHLLIIDHLKGKLGMFGKAKKQNKLLANLGDVFRQIAKDEALNLSDFPNPNKFRETIRDLNVGDFPKINRKTLPRLMEILEKEIPELMGKMPLEVKNNTKGPFDPDGASNPFLATAGASQDASGASGAKGWVVTSTQKSAYDVRFHALSLTGGLASGSQIMNVMLQSGLQRDTLKAIWDLSDIDRDGKMDHEEFALCMHLIDMVNSGLSVPPNLPMRLVPPGKRNLLEFN